MTEELDAGVLKLVKALTAERERAEKAEAALKLEQEESERLRAQKQTMWEQMTKAEAALAMVREEYRSLAKQAAADVMDWGAYASEYFQQKYDLAGDIAKYQAIAADKGADHE